MSDFVVTHLHDIPIRDKWIPVRAHFGISSFGVNAYRGDEAGARLIGAHVETISKHEELYVVVEGHATFTVDGEEVDAPAGTFVYVGDPASWRTAVAKEPGTIVLVAGAQPGRVFEVSPWETTWRENQEAMKLYREERYDAAADVLREAIKTHPNAPGLFYNLACFDSRAGANAATVAENLGRAIELNDGFVAFARGDSDLDPVRADPEIQALLGESA